MLCNILLLHDHALQVLRLELLRRDIYPSLANSTSTTAPPESLAERFLEIVKRSHARRDAIARSMQLAANGQSSAKGAVDAELAPHKRAKPSLSIPVSEDDNEGEFLTQIALGTPKQSFTAIVDTGSDLVWTQCLPCESCFPQTGPEFNPAKSSTYKPIKCGLHNLCEVWICKNLRHICVITMISDNCFFHNKDLQAPPLGDGGQSHIFREGMYSIICFTDESGGRRGKWDHPGFVRERKKWFRLWSYQGLNLKPLSTVQFKTLVCPDQLIKHTFLYVSESCILLTPLSHFKGEVLTIISQGNHNGHDIKKTQFIIQSSKML